MTRHLTANDVLALHVAAMRLSGYGPAPLRGGGASLLESAVLRTRNTEHYEPDADLARLAAQLAVGISQAQAFLDGNKRTALLSLAVFLRDNGMRIDAEPLETARRLEAVADGVDRDVSANAFETWLRGRILPL